MLPGYITQPIGKLESPWLSSTPNKNHIQILTMMKPVCTKRIQENSCPAKSGFALCIRVCDVEKFQTFVIWW